MSDAEKIAAALDHLADMDRFRRDWPLGDGLTVSEQCRQAAALIRAQAEELEKARAAVVVLSRAIDEIDSKGQPVLRHPYHCEADFGSQYFNTSDDYARYKVRLTEEEFGDIARFAKGAARGLITPSAKP